MEPEVTEGQVAQADPEGTTAAAPEGDAGQSISTDQTTQSGPGDSAKGESFFDPKSIADKPELMQAYKQMQGKFTQSMQGIRESQQKIDAYNAAMADPTGTIRQLAGQYGMTVVDGQPQPTESGEFNPKSWDDVVSHIRTQVQTELSQQYEPLIGEVKNLKQQNIEQYLDSNYADWRTYESEMIGTLQSHPSMAHDPDKLYQLSVPAEVLEARATERALKKLKGSAEAGAVSGAQRATQVTSEKPTGSLSFDDAVKFAKDSLKKQGLSAPVGG